LRFSWLAERRNPDAITRFEENVLAVLLALITIVSFTQVVARYGFNTGWGGALEFTRILFAWMILFGMSYGAQAGHASGRRRPDAAVSQTRVPVLCHFRRRVRLALCRHAAEPAGWQCSAQDHNYRGGAIGLLG
jgi:hypothetical protein